MFKWILKESLLLRCYKTNISTLPMRIPNPKGSSFFVFLRIAGALALGIVLGRYLIPASPLAFDRFSSTQGANDQSSISSASGRQSQTSHSKESARKVTLRPNETTEEQRTILAGILNKGSPVLRTREMLAFIDGLDDNELMEVVETFREAGWVDYNRNEYSLLISAWMSRAPYQAVSYLETHDQDGRTRKMAISAWAAEDPGAAYAAVQGLEDEGLINDWLVGLVEGTARNDPEAALKIVRELDSKETSIQALREVIPEVVVRGQEFASEFMDQISDPKMKKEAAHRIASTMGRRDPEAASDWVNTLDTPELRRDASGVVAEVYAREDLDGAANWVRTLPLDSKGTAAANVARLLTRENPSEAAVWLRQLGNDSSLDNARIRFLQEAGRQDPETALENVATLSRARDQERYYRELLNRWRKQDQNAAVAWANSHSELIPPNVLRSILPRQR